MTYKLYFFFSWKEIKSRAGNHPSSLPLLSVFILHVLFPYINWELQAGYFYTKN